MGIRTNRHRSGTMPRSSRVPRRQARCIEERMRTANFCGATSGQGVTSDEGLIILGHPEQQLAGLETRAVTLFQHLRALEEGRDTVGNDELQCAALMRSEEQTAELPYLMRNTHALY